MILIGSQALRYYISDLGRICHDWDYLMSKEEYTKILPSIQKYWVKTTEYSHIFDIDGTIVEIRNPDNLDETDRWLVEEEHYTNQMSTPLGLADIPYLSTLHAIKKATAQFIPEHKHTKDLELMEKSFPVSELDNGVCSLFYYHRFEETRKRTEKANKVKYDFFHKYHIPEYIKHDRIHEMFADLLGITIPTYQRITIAETDIAEELFNKLTHEQKISLMVEEVLVLNMERWFNPQMVENGINYRLVEKFYRNNEAEPTYLILKHVCLKGLKGEAKYITDFAKANFFEIEKEWIKAKEVIKSKGGFPSWYYDELFELRKKFKDKTLDLSQVV